MKTALITGATGQDAAYLIEFLLNKDYYVHGIKRRSSSINTERIDHLFGHPKLKLHYGDLSESTSLIRIIQETQPDEIYNLGAMSHVKVSFEQPEYSADIDGVGTLRILEAVRILGLTEKTKIYNATTSELYGKVQEVPQTERTPFYPRSPYGVAKLYSFWISKNYREAYNIFVSNGILFNHTSPRRGETFVCRKITMAVAKIAAGLERKLALGNLNAERDFGHAKDYVRAMWRMLQEDTPDDYVIATGEKISVRDFARKAFSAAGIEIDFVGEGIYETGVVKSVNRDVAVKPGDNVIHIDPKYFRPSEVDLLIGDATKAREKLGWLPLYDIDMIIKEMVAYDIVRLKSK